MKIRYGMVSLLLCVSMVMMCGCGKTYSAELEIGDSSNEDLGTVKENNIVTTDIVDNDNNTINADDIYDDGVALLNEWASETGQKINNMEYVKDNGEHILYAALGPSEPDYQYPYGNQEMLDSYIEVVYVDSSLKVANLGRIELVKSDPDWGDEYLTPEGYGVFDFGENQHYYVGLSGIGYGLQYKYGIVGGEKKLIDSELEFMQNEDGVYCYSQRAWGDYYHTTTEYVEVTFADDEYKQYAANEISVDKVSQEVTNWQEVVNDCISEIGKIDSIQLGEFDGESVDSVTDIAFVNVKLGSNGKYYLTFKFTTNGYEIYNKEVYFTYRLEDNKLIRESIVNYVDKLETSEIDLPVMSLDTNAIEDNCETLIDSIQFGEYAPFYGVWCCGVKDENAANSVAEEIKSKGYDAYVLISSDWSNLNSDKWYVVTAGTYASEEEAKIALSAVKAAGYDGAYVKYSGEYRGQ